MLIRRSSDYWIQRLAIPVVVISCAILPPSARAQFLDVDLQEHAESAEISGTPNISVGPFTRPRTRGDPLKPEPQAIFGTTDAAHAVTAARAAYDFAANAKIDAKDDFPTTSLNVTKIQSAATHFALIRNLQNEVSIRVGMNFHIPRSELEITLTNELPDLIMSAQIDASIYDVSARIQPVSLFNFTCVGNGSVP